MEKSVRPVRLGQCCCQQNAHLEKIGQLENLVKLDLSENDISDIRIQHLEKLTNLESLNLYNTYVSEVLLKVIPKLSRLQKVFLWETKINDSIVAKLQGENLSIKKSSLTRNRTWI
ncbi:leucine-rich repeat domain-containing protein [Maribacter halichondriae]|uniref:leucine-rich repeat domain-containing protein n=1 Tax=Maribacter halichondriae TaxID=2980554 RepID=UPI003D319F90